MMKKVLFVCLALALMISPAVMLTAPAAAVPLVVEVPVDIKPMSCPNPINVDGKGVLPVAILGTGDVAVSQIDPASVMLEGVAPLRWEPEDVATPFEGAPCECHELGPDGYLDLTLKFNMQEVITALGGVLDGEVRELTLTGVLLDGTPISGQDCVLIRAR